MFAATNKRKLSTEEKEGNEEKKIKTEKEKKKEEGKEDETKTEAGAAEEKDADMEKGAAEEEKEDAKKENYVKDNAVKEDEEENDAEKKETSSSGAVFQPPETLAKAASVVDKAPPKRCTQCRAILDNNPNLRIRENEPVDGVEEMIALTDDKLSVEGMDSEDRVTNIVTAYSIFDKNDHLVDFSVGLLEKNVELFFNGYLKPLVADNPASIEGGVPVVKVGPIHEWWSTGFDKDSVPTIGKAL